MYCFFKCSAAQCGLTKWCHGRNLPESLCYLTCWKQNLQKWNEGLYFNKTWNMWSNCPAILGLQRREDGDSIKFYLYTHRCQVSSDVSAKITTEMWGNPIFKSKLKNLLLYSKRRGKTSFVFSMRVIGHWLDISEQSFWQVRL